MTHSAEATPPSATAVEAVAAAYYTREIAAPDAARDRAERSSTIAGAIGATLLGAGVIAGLGGRSALLTALGVTALALWALAAALFVRAVGAPVKRVAGEGTVDEQQFVERALELARAEVDAINRRHGCARWAGGAAVVVTLAAMAVAALGADGPDRRTVLLADRGAKAVAAACGTSERSSVVADVWLSTLDEAYVSLRAAFPGCDLTLRLARSDVIALIR